jgi:orotidine-5'-phosphate decarboxylase
MDQLAAAVRERGNAVCVGLDPRWEQLPPAVIETTSSAADAAHRADAYAAFSRGVIDAVADLVPIVKPQSAFFEELGPAGVTALV